MKENILIIHISQLTGVIFPAAYPTWQSAILQKWCVLEKELLYTYVKENAISFFLSISRLTVVRRAAKKRSARPIKIRGHYCELFTCRVGFAILALDYATYLNGFVLRYVIKKSLVVVFLRPC